MLQLMDPSGGAHLEVERNGDHACDGEPASVAHRLRQPLAAIVSYARGAILRSRRGTLTQEDLERVLEIVIAQALRAAAELQRPAGDETADESPEGDSKGTQ